jgi:hypothetical protein
MKEVFETVLGKPVEVDLIGLGQARGTNIHYITNCSCWITIQRPKLGGICHVHT